MNKLYPLKFNPIYKEKIWGGQNLKTFLNKNIPKNKPIGESWEISGIENENSIVNNGFLEENELNELIEIYMGDLIGDRVYDRFGCQFPLLIKFIDANKDLSIQVHPNNKIAQERHNDSGKTEMWYIINSQKESKLVSGFNREINKTDYLNHVKQNELINILNFEKAKAGDVFYIPAGQVHSIGEGILLAEIQQTSDITYRIFDWNRQDQNGNLRELHTENAIDALDYSTKNNGKTEYTINKNSSSKILKSPFFETNIISFDKCIELDYNNLDSFVIFMCITGELELEYYESEKIKLTQGETILIPAVIEYLKLNPVTPSKLLEIYIPEPDEKPKNKK